MLLSSQLPLLKPEDFEQEFFPISDRKRSDSTIKRFSSFLREKRSSRQNADWKNFFERPDPEAIRQRSNTIATSSPSQIHWTRSTSTIQEFIDSENEYSMDLKKFAKNIVQLLKEKENVISKTEFNLVFGGFLEFVEMAKKFSTMLQSKNLVENNLSFLDLTSVFTESVSFD